MDGPTNSPALSFGERQVAAACRAWGAPMARQQLRRLEGKGAEFGTGDWRRGVSAGVFAEPQEGHFSTRFWGKMF